MQGLWGFGSEFRLSELEEQGQSVLWLRAPVQSVEGLSVQ